MSGNENGASRRARLTSHSGMDDAYLQRRTEMFQSLNMEGYWKIGTGDAVNAPKRKKTPKPKAKPKARAK